MYHTYYGQNKTEQSWKTYMKSLEFKVYVKEPKLCVVDNLKEYLRKTSPNRKDYNLFISYQKPYGPVTTDTISRWCKQMMGMAGIDINKYCSHSSRSAASSFAKHKGVSLKTIIDTAGWASQCTFAAYYEKCIEDDETIGSRLLFS